MANAPYEKQNTLLSGPLSAIDGLLRHLASVRGRRGQFLRQSRFESDDHLSKLA